MPERGPAHGRISWPGGKRFAFTIFDDPDSQTCADSSMVYALLRDAGLRTTKAVWPLDLQHPRNSPGDTCADSAFRRHAQELQEAGFEIGYHNAAPHDAARDETIAGLQAFQSYFGHPPASMANHYNAEAIYWGSARLSGARRAIYRAVMPARGQRFSGHIETSPFFWGDVCRETIRYCRNLVFANINTLAVCPFMPYHDPLRAYVPNWFASSEGAQYPAFVKMLTTPNLDRLEEEGGACIMYTHFGLGFVNQGRLEQPFVAAIGDVARRNGWFVPVATLLDYLQQQRGPYTLTESDRSRLEWRWLGQKLFRGTS